VTPFDACAFGEAVEGLLKDRARYEFYRSACKQTLEDTFSLQSIGDKLEALYARVIAEKRTTQTD
jgi:glycosyltransferase involved in cell wall biosynthesis